MLSGFPDLSPMQPMNVCPLLCPFTPLLYDPGLSLLTFCLVYYMGHLVLHHSLCPPVLLLYSLHLTQTPVLTCARFLLLSFPISPGNFLSASSLLHCMQFPDPWTTSAISPEARLPLHSRVNIPNLSSFYPPFSNTSTPIQPVTRARMHCLYCR